MKMLFFSHYFYPEGNAPASRTYENARRWVAAGHEVTVITCAPNVPAGIVYEGYKNSLYKKEIIDGIHVIRVWTYIAPNKGTFRRIINYVSYMISSCLISLFLKRPDVIIATSPQFFCGWAGIIVSKLKGVRLLLEIRDIWPESIIAVGAMKKSRLMVFLEWLELKMYAAAYHIVTVGDGYKKRLVEKNVEPKKISVIMNGVDRNLFTTFTLDTDLKSKWGFNNKFVCIYSGTIGMACGLQVVVDAAQKLTERGIDDILFLLVGDGAARFDLEKQVANLNVSNVLFTGRQPKEIIPQYLAMSDVSLVHLKKTDLFTTVMPSKIFEAAGMGLPIINGVEGFAADFIKQANAGINIESENSDELIDALLTLKKDHRLRQAYGKSGHEYVHKHFDRDKLADNYINIIMNVFNQNHLHENCRV